LTFPYLSIPLFPLEDALKRGVNALCANTPRVMPDYPDHAPPSEDYRQLAHRLRELAQETRQPYARQELLRLSGIYDRRAEHLERGAD
jgi:DICT domain-containing protein